MFFNPGNGEFIRTDARFDPSKNLLTYWWAYTTDLIVEPQRPAEKKPWAVILCRFKGQPSNQKIGKLFRGMFTPANNAMFEYWHDVSLGRLDIAGSKVFGWIELDLTRSNAGGMKRTALVNAAIAACKRDGIEVEKGFFSQIAVFINNWSVDKHPTTGEKPPGGIDWSNAAQVAKWGPFWLDGSSDGKKVSAPLHGHSGSFIAHEMAHGMNFSHDLAADLKTAYGDKTCIMSALNVEGFEHPTLGSTFGPSMSFPQLQLKGYMYKRRIFTAAKNWQQQAGGISFNMAAINDRRSHGYLGAIVPVNAAGTWSYYLEYMTPTGWNKGLGTACLVVRRIVGNTAAFLGRIKLPGTLQASRSWKEPSGNIRFEIKKIQSDQRIISVTVSKS